MISLATGVWLWWPRDRGPGRWRSAFIRHPRRGRLRWLDWHSLVAVYLFAPLLVLTVTGVWLAQPGWFRWVLVGGTARGVVSALHGELMVGPIGQALVLLSGLALPVLYATGLMLTIGAILLAFLRLKASFDGTGGDWTSFLFVDKPGHLVVVIPLFTVIALAGLFVAASEPGSLQDAGVVDVKKSFNGNRPQTWCKLTAAGRKRFADYVTALEKVVSDAVALDAPRKRNASPGLNLA